MGDLSQNFDRSEFACKDNCGFDNISSELISLLEEIRAIYNSPVIIYSGCRCNKYNKLVGGVSDSQHLYGNAADIYIVGVHPHDLADHLSNYYPDKYGVGKYANFTHIDVRDNGPARWGF